MAEPSDRTQLRSVGQSHVRADGTAKTTGAATYLADITLTDMLYAAVVRSPFPRAKVLAIDASEALALPGVHAVMTPADVAHLPPVRIFADSPPIQRILTDTPQFVGDPVAAVVADSLALARQAVMLIEVEYETLTPILDIDIALTGKPQLHPEAPENRAGPVINIARGEADAVLSNPGAGIRVFRDTYETNRQAAQTIESLACVCEETEDGSLHVWTHLDSMFHFRDALAEALMLEPAAVVVHPPPALGATFGLKNSLIAGLEPLCALLAKRVGRPVKLTLAPDESMSCTVTRHASRITLATAVDSSGRIVGRSADVTLDSGAYGWGYVVALSMLGKWATLYRCDDIRFTANSVYTNHVPGGAYRSVGTAQIHFAMESQMDEIARELDLDPIDFRLRNVVGVGDTLSMGTVIRSLGTEECLVRGAEAFGWDASQRDVVEPFNPLGSSRGIGMALGMHHAGLTGLIPTPEGSTAKAELLGDGQVRIDVGVIEKGQGSDLTLTLVAAEELGMSPNEIQLRNLGTDAVPLDYSGAEASRTTYIVGRAVADAARNLRAKINHRAADALGCDAATIRVDAATGSAMGPSDSIGLADLAAAGGLSADGAFTPTDKDPLPVIGAHFCEVEVDNVTGAVHVLRYVAAQDVGRIINPLGCLGQIEGGLHHGLGYALLEEFICDDGQPINSNFMGYKVLMAPDMPAIDAVMVEDPDPDGGPFGAKGVGTPVIPAIAACVANAVRDAVGVRFHQLPLRPERVLAGVISREGVG